MYRDGVVTKGSVECIEMRLLPSVVLNVQIEMALRSEAGYVRLFDYVILKLILIGSIERQPQLAFQPH